MVLGPLGDVVEAVGDVTRSAYDEVAGTAASVFGSDPSGRDGRSSVWEAWGHPELYSMVRDTVSPGDIQEGAAAYRQVGTRIRDSFDGFAGDLEGIVQGGWRGQSAEAATGALAPLRDWSGQLSAAVGQTGEVMGASGESAEQARRDVPEPVDFNAAQTLRSAGSGLLGGGPVGALLGGGMDAVTQERVQDEARAEAVRVMNTSYSPPLLESRESVPEYPRPINPTTVAPEAPPIGGPSPDPGGPGEQGPGGGGSTGGGGTGSQSHQPYQQPEGGAVSSPAAAEPGPVGTGGQAAPGGPGGSQQSGGGSAGTGGTASPGMAPVAGGFGGAGSGQAQPSGRYGGAGGAGGAVQGGGSRGGGSAGGGFGPRGSGGGGSAAGGAGGSGQRPSGGSGGQGAGGAAAAAGRAGGGAGRGGGMPFGAMGAGRGPGGEDSEHQRKILIEAERDAIVGQLDAVAPPVIGEDPDVYQRDDNR